MSVVGSRGNNGGVKISKGNWETGNRMPWGMGVLGSGGAILNLPDLKSPWRNVRIDVIIRWCYIIANVAMARNKWTKFDYYFYFRLSQLLIIFNWLQRCQDSARCNSTATQGNIGKCGGVKSDSTRLRE